MKRQYLNEKLQNISLCLGEIGKEADFISAKAFAISGQNVILTEMICAIYRENPKIGLCFIWFFCYTKGKDFMRGSMMNFTKMQGLGNDFIIVNGLVEDLGEDYGALAQKLCDRHFGIGGDGLMLVLPSTCADIKMRIINSDGSEPEMCGNGIRCFAQYVYQQGIVTQKSMTVETLAGIMVPEIVGEDALISLVKVDMGEPILKRALIPMLGTGEVAVNEEIKLEDVGFHVTAVSMGNPHCVTFVENLAEFDLLHWGPLMERSPYFPKKVNSEFVQVLNAHEVVMRVWERGAGVTLACGTGACASVVACVLNEKTIRDVVVHLDGGDLRIQWDMDTNHVFMTGPAQLVFEGQVHAI